MKRARLMTALLLGKGPQRMTIPQQQSGACTALNSLLLMVVPAGPTVRWMASGRTGISDSTCLVQQRSMGTNSSGKDEEGSGSGDGCDGMAVLFWALPLPERLAAVTVARFMINGSGDCGDDDASGERRNKSDKGTFTPITTGVQPLPPLSTDPTAAAAVHGAMPLNTFVVTMPDATRDAIFQSRRDVAQFIGQSAVLELVYQHPDESVGTTPAPATPSSSSSSSSSVDVPRYGPLRFVRVKGGEAAAAAVLSLIANGANLSPSCRRPATTTASATTATGALGDGNATDTSNTNSNSDTTGIDGGFDSSNPSHVDGLLTALTGALQRRLTSHNTIASSAANAASSNNDKSSTGGSRQYVSFTEAYLSTMREAARYPAERTLSLIARRLTRDDFEAALLAAEVSSATGEPIAEDCGGDAVTARVRAVVWVVHGGYVALRTPSNNSTNGCGGDLPPRFVSPQPHIRRAGQENNYGGWGAADAIPTRDDVREILRFVPINWGNLSNMQIPAPIKKRHLRSSSPLQWFRRQPYYFEVRNMNGTTEIRRSRVLHPATHGLAPEAAREQLELAIADGTANDLMPLGPDGSPLTAEMSTVEAAIHRFFYRVCPPYFAPLSLVMQRYTRKNLTEGMLLDMARRRPGEFEILRPRYLDDNGTGALVRKRVGADSQRWRSAFAADLESRPEDVRGIVAVMNRLCPAWDRPEYVYVRLSPPEQRAVGGYESMMALLRRHPAIFRVGERLVSRVDSSDPFAAQEAEPDVADMTSRSYLREENPYLSPSDIAIVFHYAAPLEEACTASFLVACASPAMQVALPPRVVTIVQQFPRLFACKETAPGVYSIRKIASRGGGGGHGQATTTTTTTGMNGTQQQQQQQQAASDEDNDEDDSWLELEAEIAAEEQLSRPALLRAVLELVPVKDGVEAAQLLLWASMVIQRSAGHHHGGLLKMVQAEAAHFRIVDSPDSKRIFRRDKV